MKSLQPLFFIQRLLTKHILLGEATTVFSSRWSIASEWGFTGVAFAGSVPSGLKSWWLFTWTIATIFVNSSVDIRFSFLLQTLLCFLIYNLSLWKIFFTLNVLLLSQNIASNSNLHLCLFCSSRNRKKKKKKKNSLFVLSRKNKIQKNKLKIFFSTSHTIAIREKWKKCCDKAWFTNIATRIVSVIYIV